ncbi:MAG: hypothetical protein AB7G44_07280 [Bacteroidia bacterium]
MYYGDLHCHPSFKPVNSIEDALHVSHPPDFYNSYSNNCSSIEGTLLNSFSKSVLKKSQSCIKQLVDGNVRIAFASLFPLEKQFTNPKLWLAGEKSKNRLISCLTGMHPNKVGRLRNKEINYFEELQAEYRLIKVASLTQNIFLPVNYSELENSLNTNSKINFIINFEGIQSLAKIDAYGKIDNSSILNNIDVVKSWQNPPFFITFNHHFSNGLAGHAHSLMSEMTKSSFLAPSGVFGQKELLAKGIEPLGYAVMTKLLEKENGRKRILIDIKHMSALARQQFYKWHHDNYVIKEDNVPIICSHTGITSYNPSLAQLVESEKNESFYELDYKSTLHEWPINLCAEDVQKIHKSGGLVGLQLDMKRICGKNMSNKLATKGYYTEQDQKKIIVKIVALNLLHMVRCVGNKTGWDILCIGSDNDGFVSCIEGYETSDKFPNLANNLEKFFDNPEDIFHGPGSMLATHITELKHGYSGKQIVEKVFRDNVLTFLQKHFN